MGNSLLMVESLTHRYGERIALDKVSFEVPDREIFGLLGPNGGGKTTLFRILSTLVVPREGNVRMFGMDVARHQSEIRRRIGVVFQSPSLDRKLTVLENLRHQGHLYNLRGHEFNRGLMSCSRVSGWPIARRIWWKRFPADSGDGSNWPRVCCTNRRCSCWTSPVRASTHVSGANYPITSSSCATRMA